MSAGMRDPAAADAVGQWERALRAVRDRLDDLERTLEVDDWSTSSDERPVVVDAPLPAELEPAVQRLVVRLQQLERRLNDELRETYTALIDIDARRMAARNYQKSFATTSAGGSADD